MKKVELVKKLVLSVLVMLYDIVSLFLCYIIVSNLIYVFSFVSVNENSISIIGAADTPPSMFIMGKVLRCGFSIPFVLLSIATVFLLTVTMFKKQTSPKLSILLWVFSVLTLIVFMLISAQTYVISLYTLVRKLSFLKYIQILYIILSLVIIVKNILFAVKRRKREE